MKNDQIENKIIQEALHSVLKRTCHAIDFEIMGLAEVDNERDFYLKALVVQVVSINFDKYKEFQFRDSRIYSYKPTPLSRYDDKLIRLRSEHKNLVDALVFSNKQVYFFRRHLEEFLKDFDEFMDYHDKEFNTKAIGKDDLVGKDIVNIK